MLDVKFKYIKMFAEENRFNVYPLYGKYEFKFGVRGKGRNMLAFDVVAPKNSKHDYRLGIMIVVGHEEIYRIEYYKTQKELIDGATRWCRKYGFIR